MSEKKETITIKDILDGLLSKDSVDALAAIDSAETIRILLGHVASRIEAAVERERNAHTNDIHDVLYKATGIPGNSAALREALENVERVARFCAETPRHTPGYPTDAARADVLHSRIVELGRVAHAALAAPARNCDRAECADVESAWATYCAETNRADCKGFARWFFAPAAAEGGDHA